MIAFGHPDNVLSLAKHLGEKVDLTVAAHLNGDFYQQGVLQFAHRDLKPGVYRDTDFINTFLPLEVRNFFSKNFKIWFIKTKNLKLLRDKWFVNLRVIIRAFRAIQEEDYDIIHFNGTSGFFIYYRILFWNKKIVWTLHDYRSHRGEENWWHEFQTKWLLRSNLVVIQHYQYLAKSISNYYSISPGKVFQIYSGTFDVLTAFGENRILKESNYYLFFGRISKYKGIEYLIEAFNKLPTPRPKLVIAGKGELETRELADDIIIINRYIETAELNSLIKNCLCVVVPYTDATHSGTIMSAYTHRKPVIASSVDGIREVLINGETGLLVNPCDVDGLRNAMNRMNPLQTGEIQPFNFNDLILSSGHLSWDHCISDYLRLYSSLTSDN